MSEIKKASTGSARNYSDKGRVVPQVLPTDLIYKNPRSVFVVPEYKLIFFTFPKVSGVSKRRGEEGGLIANDKSTHNTPEFL